MYKNNLCSIFLYVLLKTCIPEAQSSMERYVEFQNQIGRLVHVQKINDYTSRLRIGNAPSKYVYCEVYVFDPKTNPMTADVLQGKSAKLYTCVNCKFAEWTRNQLIKLIEPALLRVDNLSINYYNGKINAKFGHSENAYNIVDIVTLTNAMFVNVLFNFTNILSGRAQLDTSILITLLSFHIKMHLIQSRCVRDTETSTGGGTGYVSEFAVPKLLETINLVQKFEALNCGEPRLFHENQRYYGYPTMDAAMNKNDNIKEFVDSIAPLKLNDTHNYCAVDQFLLRERVTRSDDTLSECLSEMTVGSVCKGRAVSLRDVYEQVERTDDLAVVHWYQSIVYDAIIRVLCIRLNSVEPYDPKRLKALEFFYSDVAGLPTVVVESFKLLAAENVPTANRRSALRVLDEYRKGRQGPDNAGNGIFAGMPPYTLLFAERLVESRTFLNIDDDDDDLEDYKCFVRVHELLYRDHRTDPPVSRARNSRRVRDFVDRTICGASDPNDDDGMAGGQTSTSTNVAGSDRNSERGRSPTDDSRTTVDDGCVLVYRLYRRCIETFVGLSRSRKDPGGSFARQYSNVAQKNIQSIVTSLTDFADAHESVPFADVTFRLVPSWTMIRHRLFKERGGQSSNVLRFLYLIATDLIAIDMETCDPSGKLEYLMLHGIGGGKEGRGHAIDVRGGVSDVSDDGMNSINAKLLTFTELLRLFDGKPPVFRKYENVLSIFWKGRKMKTDDIHLALRSAVSSPIFVYSLYDVYFKFCFAVFVYETENLFNALLKIRDDKLNDRLNDRLNQIVRYEMEKSENGNYLPVEMFPECFRGYIQNYNLYVKHGLCVFIPNGDGFVKSRANLFRQRVFDEIDKLGIFLHFKEATTLPEKEVSQNSSKSGGLMGCIDTIFPPYKSKKLPKEVLDNDPYFDHNLCNTFFSGILHDLSAIIKEYNRFKEIPCLSTGK